MHQKPNNENENETNANAAGMSQGLYYAGLAAVYSLTAAATYYNNPNAGLNDVLVTNPLIMSGMYAVTEAIYKAGQTCTKPQQEEHNSPRLKQS